MPARPSRVATVLVLYLVCSSGAPAANTPESQSEYSELKSAAAQIAQGKLSEAESKLQSILSATPSEYQAWNLLGVVRAQQGRAPEAERMFQKAIQGDAKLVGARVNLGLLYSRLNRPHDAVGQFEKALEIEPGRGDAVSGLVSALSAEAAAAVRNGNDEKALSLLIRARKLDTQNATLLFQFGMVALRMQLFDDAGQAFQKALRLYPDNPRSVYALARAEIGLNHYSEAEQALRRYLELRPSDATAHYGLGYVLRLLQRNREARKEFERSLELRPEQTESTFQLGVVDLEEGQTDRAATRFRQVLERDPRHVGALLAQGELLFQEKNYQAALEPLQQAARIAPDAHKSHYYLGLCYARLGQRGASQQELALAAKLQHQNVEQTQTVLRLLDPAKTVGPNGDDSKDDAGPPQKRN